MLCPWVAQPPFWHFYPMKIFVSLTILTLENMEFDHQHSHFLHFCVKLLCKILRSISGNSSRHCSRIWYNHLPKIFAKNLQLNLHRYVSPSDPILNLWQGNLSRGIANLSSESRSVVYLGLLETWTTVSKIIFLYFNFTGKSLSEAFIFAEHGGEHDVYINCSEYQKQFLYTTYSPQVWAWNFHVLNL